MEACGIAIRYFLFGLIFLLVLCRNGKFDQFKRDIPYTCMEVKNLKYFIYK